MGTFSFEKLKVWEKSRSPEVTVCKTTKDYPDKERFGLTSQIRRYAVSISSNITEGSGRHSKKEKARFTEIAYGSGLELLNQSILSKDLEFLTTKDYSTIRNKLTEILSMLDGLYKSQLDIWTLKLINPSTHKRIKK